MSKYRSRDDGFLDIYDKKTPSYPPGRALAPYSSPSRFRKKARAAAFYFLASTIHDLLNYKIAQRTFWPNAIVLIPLQALFLAIITGTIMFVGKKRGTSVAVNISGPDSILRPLAHWRETLPLVITLLGCATLYTLQAPFLEVAISTSIMVNRCLSAGTFYIEYALADVCRSRYDPAAPLSAASVLHTFQ